MSKRHRANFDKVRQDLAKLDIWKEVGESEKTSEEKVKKSLGRTGLHALDASQDIFNLIEMKSREAVIDGLTGCFNQTYFKKFKREKFNPKYDDKLVGMVFVDLDDFKSINDTLGHRVGDEVLVQMATLLRSEFRTQRSDNIFRIGGDEFAVVCRNKDIDDQFEDILKQKMLRLQETANINFSYGVAVFDKNQDIDLDSTKERADFNMYENKKEKNQRDQATNQ